MRVSINDYSVKLWLSASDTYDWATRPGASWPGSALRSRRLFAEFDRNGLLDLSIDGGRGDQDCDSDELNAITSDYLAARLPESHPAYGQFQRS